LKLDRELRDGDEIALGESPDGRPGWALRVLHTPGHADSHVALHDQRHSSLIAGDLVSTLVSMYVGSPGGSLRQYFASIEKILALEIQTLYPSHGTPAHNPRGLLEDTVHHRRQRIEDVFRSLSGEPAAVEAVAFKVYRNVDSKLRPLIIRSTRAALEYLEEEGRARKAGEDSYRTA
jgi:glyoxylase-like metal-dependent hydrolase (beta-lactamase superfamily II)